MGDMAGFAPAKINLTLHVTGRRAEGYHLLDSLVAFADVGDRLTVAPGDGLTVVGPFAQGVPVDGTNIINRALALAGQRRAVTLDKQLPHPAGIGGGSSDAAAVLRLIGADLSPAQVLSLGADVPVCVLAGAARMSGIGEDLTPVDLPPLWAVLVNPGLPVPTGQVFGAMARRDNAPMGELPRWRDTDELLAWIVEQRNDLEDPARSVAPGIGEVLEAIERTGAVVSRMSGSGATCFGLYRDMDAARTAAEGLARPGWWVRATTLQ